MALGIVSPCEWFAGPAESPSYLSVKFVPPQRVVSVPPPSARPPQLSHVVRSTAPQPAVTRVRAARPPMPRSFRVASPTAQWSQLPPVVAFADVPETRTNAVAAVKSEGLLVPGNAVASNSKDVASAGENGGSTGNGTSADGNGSAAHGPGDGPLGMPGYSQTPLPAYPRLAKLRGWEGVTVLRVEVREDGGVGRVEMARSSGHGALDDAAMKAVRAWRFEPARRGNTAVPCVIEVPIRFKLDNAGA